MAKGWLYLKDSKKYLVLEDKTEVQLQKGWFAGDLDKSGKKHYCTYEIEIINNITKYKNIKFAQSDETLKGNIDRSEQQRNPNRGNNQGNNRGNNQNNGNIPSVAPYNFVPLNTDLIEVLKNSDNNNENTEKYTGHIDLEVENLTHIYTKGNTVGEFFNYNGKYGIPGSSVGEFFNYNGKYGIPGSSFRGMLRTLVEIVTFGKFVNFDDRALFQRLPGTKAITAGQNRKLGFLKYENYEFRIYVYNGIVRTVNKDNSNFEYNLVLDTNILTIKSGGLPPAMARNVKDFEMDYSKIGEKNFVILDEIIDNYEGDKNRNAGKNMKNLLDTVMNRDNGLARQINNYNTRNPHNKKSYNGIPIWYELDETETIVVGFGHCKNYRIKYYNSIGDAVNSTNRNLTNKSLNDMAECIFGTEDAGGRVFFEDAYAQNPDFEEAPLQILANPKPTAHKLYLEQEANRIITWNDDAKIRGYKLYWHRNTCDTSNLDYNWRKMQFREQEINLWNLTNTEKDGIIIESNNPKKIKIRPWAEITESIKNKIRAKVNQDDKAQFKIVKTIKPNCKFLGGRIRFEELSEVELGALLFVLNLPQNCYYKLGMGKPLGLGTIKMESKLHVYDLKERYSKMLNEDGTFYEPEIKCDTDLIIKSFTDFICKSILNNDKIDIWQIPRMQELKALLTYDETKMSQDSWLTKTNYMELADFKRNGKLQTAKELIDVFNRTN